MYEESVRQEFTHQTDSFASSPVPNMAETLATLVDLVPADPAARWLEVACGPAIVGRAIAAKVGSVQGVDLTPAMVEKAQAEAAAEEISNVAISLGDATALQWRDAEFDGAITRFSLHHIPAPGRVLREMARVVRPGGYIVLADHLTDSDGDAAAWHEQIERLRDPSHWACLTRERLIAAGERAGLELDTELEVPLDLDFEEWLMRGSGGEATAPLIDQLLESPPASAKSFRVTGSDGERRLLLRTSVSRWRVPA